jgi:Uma2 family endonuclease
MTLAASPSVAPSIRRYTAEEFLELPDHRGFELEDGILQEMALGSESTWIAGEIYSHIRSFVNEKKLGWAFPLEAVYRCFPDHPARIRKPDASFVRYGRLENERIPTGFISVAPDLVVEVISPNDIALKVEREIQEYLSVEVPLIWIIYPETRTAHVHRLNGQPSDLHGSDEFDGEDVIPGFRVRLDQLFQPVPS